MSDIQDQQTAFTENARRQGNACLPTSVPPQPNLNDIQNSIIASNDHLASAMDVIVRMEANLLGIPSSQEESADKPDKVTYPGFVEVTAAQADKLAGDIMHLAERLSSLEKRLLGG